MKTLPDNLTLYKSTRLFTNQTVPQALLHNHTTKDGVWAKITVEKGSLEYTIAGDKTYVITTETHGVIEPQVLHYVHLNPDTSFFIEFYHNPITNLS